MIGAAHFKFFWIVVFALVTSEEEASAVMTLPCLFNTGRNESKYAWLGARRSPTVGAAQGGP